MTTPPPRLRVPAAAAALLGAAFGASGPVHQNVVEAGQALAGIATGDPPTLFALQQTQPWSGATQLAALLLTAGVPADELSVLVSAATGARSFAALAVLARAAGATSPVAVLIAPFALATGLLDVSDLHYPIDLAFTPYSWGALGLWTTVLGIGLYAAGRLRAATVVLGLLPAVHPGIAVLIAPVLLLVAAARLVDDPGTLRRVALPAALALGASVGSLALHLLWLRLPLPPVDDAARALTAAWEAGFDIHRRPIPPTAWTLGTVLFALALPALLRGVPRTAREAFAGLGLLGLLGLLAQAANAYAPDLLPAVVSKTIPGRLVNPGVIAAVVGGAVVLAGGGRPARTAAAVFGAAMLAAVPGGPLDGATRGLHAAAMVAAMVAAVLSALAARRRGGGRVVGPATALAAAAVILVAAALRVPVGNWSLFAADRAGTSAAAAALGAGTGPILTGPMLDGVQMRTGRPVTIETAQMDQIHYAPGLALGFHRVLRAAYGIDFAVLPPDGRRNRMLYVFEDDVRQLWEARTAADWAAVGREFGFTAVWVRSGWRLELDPLADDGRFAVFRVAPAP
ncbi:MAG: hypothetical protein ACK5YI_22395 [Rhodospirillales bacterium]